MEEMRIVVLGGAGGLGQAAARTLAASAEVETLTLADRDVDGVAALAGELGPIADPVGADCSDPAVVRELLGEAHLVINAMGPYRSTASTTLAVAIELGVAYADACDDAATTIELLDQEFDARKSGMVAITGAGLSPGLSNLLALVAARELDELVNLRTGWSVDAGEGGFRSRDDLVLDPSGEPSTALQTWAERIHSDVELPLDHQPTLNTMVPHRVNFPAIGSGTAWTTGHPESITLPRVLEIPGSADNLMVMRRSTAAEMLHLRAGVVSGELDPHQVATVIGTRRRTRSLRGWWRTLRTPGPGGLPAFFAIAEGKRDGAWLRVGAQLSSLPPGLDHAAGITLALAGQLLLGQDDIAPGVYSVEEVIEPDVLLERLAPWCEPPVEAEEQFIEITIEQI